MLYKLTTDEFHFIKSLTCVHNNLSSLMAFCQASRLSSSDTLKISKPRVLYLLYAFTKFGLSSRHGRHQLAQKSIKTVLPRKLDSEMVLPNGSCNTISGATLPTAVLPSTSMRLCSSCAYLLLENSAKYLASTCFKKSKLACGIK